MYIISLSLNHSFMKASKSVVVEGVVQLQPKKVSIHQLFGLFD